ncbi:fibronectin type III domain-containing protein [Cryomorphaceae bacterium 1068]|nr:fibronectin type III domain-containing protein [Cryomorphaceae bacterium 1068]
MSKIKMGIASLSTKSLVTFSKDVERNMDGNANFPSPVPTIAELTAKRIEFVDAASAAKFGDRRAIFQRNTLGEELKEMLRQLGAYVAFVAQGDGNVILSSGFEVRREAEPTPPITEPTDLNAERSGQSGQVILDWAAVRYALNYQVEMTTTDPADPAAVWSPAGLTSKSKMTVDNLNPGTYYWFRVKAYGRRDEKSGFSDPALVMAA